MQVDAASCDGPLEIACPPKVNLYLRIVRKRDDGFHELETVFQSVGGGDLLRAAACDRLLLECDDPAIPVDDRNLVLRAAILLRARYPSAERLGAEMRLSKRTPVGAGMGGGSVDGAGALVLLSRLWGVTPSEGEYAEMAAALGSDVPFFLKGGAALARGRGEILESLPAPSIWLVLLKPPVSVRTAWAYGRWRPELCGGATVEEFSTALESGDPGPVAAAMRNDLEPGVMAGVPEVSAAAEWLRRQDLLGIRMTGSGSVVFGIARNREQACGVASRVGAPGRLWAAPALSASEAALTPRSASAVSSPAR